jgi:O-antigen/teichoic acid export membrane protein
LSQNTQQLAQATIRGTLWSYASKYSGKVLKLISTIILARLLSQEDFGLAGYAVLAINFMDSVSDIGIGTALIYLPERKNASDTAFWLSIVSRLILFALTWITSPWIGAFFDEPRAIPLIRTLALSFPIMALAGTHSALLQKDLKFNLSFVADIMRAVGNGLVSITLALLGFGAWSLVLGQMAGHVCSVIATWVVNPWRPSFSFSRQRARELLSYGVNIIFIGLVGVFLLNVDYILVGRYLGTVALGVYTLSFRMPEILIQQFSWRLSRVVFPVYVKLREDQGVLKDAFLKTMKYTSAFVIPLGLGLAVVAEPLVLVFFSNKWVEAIPVVRAISIFAMMSAIPYTAGDILKAQGKLKVLNYLVIFRTLLVVTVLWWVTVRFAQIVAVGWAHAVIASVTSLVYLLVFCSINRIQILDVLKGLMPIFASGILMSVGVFVVLQLLADMPSLVQLLVGVVLGVGAYVGMLFVFERELLFDARRILLASLSKGQ